MDAKELEHRGLVDRDRLFLLRLGVVAVTLTVLGTIYVIAKCKWGFEKWWRKQDWSAVHGITGTFRARFLAGR